MKTIVRGEFNKEFGVKFMNDESGNPTTAIFKLVVKDMTCYY